MSDPDSAYGSSFTLDSMKVIAESVGIGSLGDDAAKELADDVTYRLKVIVQDAMKFMHHSKRQKLSITDIDHALKIKNIEVYYTYILVYTSHILRNVKNAVYKISFRLNTDLFNQTHYHLDSLLVVEENYISLKKKKLIYLRF